MTTPTLFKEYIWLVKTIFNNKHKYKKEYEENIKDCMESL